MHGRQLDRCVRLVLRPCRGGSDEFCRSAKVNFNLYLGINMELSGPFKITLDSVGAGQITHDSVGAAAPEPDHSRFCRGSTAMAHAFVGAVASGVQFCRGRRAILVAPT
eukprot:COSAG05_NODE_10591_length_556_cov_3.061269_2_plen_109_part_00